MRAESVSLLWDVSDACKQVKQFIAGLSEAEYRQNAMVRSAVERQLEIVGEALNTLRKSDVEVAGKVPDLHRLVGLRNLLIHGYAMVDDSVVYAAATERIPKLLITVKKLLDKA